MTHEKPQTAARSAGKAAKGGAVEEPGSVICTHSSAPGLTGAPTPGPSGLEPAPDSQSGGGASA